MPQMDAVTFLPQVTWLVVVFTLLYLIVLDKILPTLSRILKLRAKKLSQGKEFSTLVADEEAKLNSEASEILFKSAKESNLLLQEKVQALNTWLPETLKAKLSTETGTMGTLNKNYLNALSKALVKGLSISKLS